MRPIENAFRNGGGRFLLDPGITSYSVSACPLVRFRIGLFQFYRRICSEEIQDFFLYRAFKDT